MNTLYEGESREIDAFMLQAKTHETLIQIADHMKGLAAHMHPPVPNPAPLGLIAFGLTTALAMIKHTRIGGFDKTDLEGVDSALMGFALFFGGLLQVTEPR
jgi:succinate-acetate transporter protein